MRRRAGSWVVALACAGLAACSTSGASTTESAPAARVTTTRATKVDAGCRYLVAATGSRYRKAPEELKYLQTATIEPGPCYDKITFTFGRGNGPDEPPGYLVEYREAPFDLPGVANSTAGLAEAHAVLFVELRPAATVDQRLGRPIQTYLGGLRLSFDGDLIGPTVIVEWLKDLPPAPFVRSSSTTTTSGEAGPTTSPTTRRRNATTSSSTTAPTTTSTTVAVNPNAPIDVAQQRVVWLIGLESKRPFTVDATSQPGRVSILVLHR